MILQGDARRIPLADESTHMCVTSPPYYGLRDYGLATWLGGDAECDHLGPPKNTQAGFNERYTGKPPKDEDKQGELRVPFKGVCRKCGAIRQDGGIGLEKTPEEYVANIVAVFREVWRVLRPDGTLWLNMGLSYDGRGNLVDQPSMVRDGLVADGWFCKAQIIWHKPNPMPSSQEKRPTVAHEVVWLLAKHKGTDYYYDAEAIKEPSQTDPRENYPARATVLGRGRQPSHGVHPSGPQQDSSGGYPMRGNGRNRRDVWTIPTSQFGVEVCEACATCYGSKSYRGLPVHIDDEGVSRKICICGRRDAWMSHFATFPPALVEPCILAGTSAKGVCPGCGKPWERVTERTPVRMPETTLTAWQRGLGAHDRIPGGRYHGKHASTDPQAAGQRILRSVKAARDAGGDHDKPFPPVQTTGWHPTCDHYDERYMAFPRPHHERKRRQQDAQFAWWWGRVRARPGGDDWPVARAIALDPFCGSGTVGEVCRLHGRRFVGLDLSMRYLKHLALPRAEGKQTAECIDALPLFSELITERGAPETGEP